GVMLFRRAIEALSGRFGDTAVFRGRGRLTIHEAVDLCRRVDPAHLCPHFHPRGDGVVRRLSFGQRAPKARGSFDPQPGPGYSTSLDEQPRLPGRPSSQPASLILIEGPKADRSKRRRNESAFAYTQVAPMALSNAGRPLHAGSGVRADIRVPARQPHPSTQNTTGRPAVTSPEGILEKRTVILSYFRGGTMTDFPVGSKTV